MFIVLLLPLSAIHRSTAGLERRAPRLSGIACERRANRSPVKGLRHCLCRCGYVKTHCTHTHTHTHCTDRGNAVRCTDDQLCSYHSVFLWNNEATVELVRPVQRVSAALDSLFTVRVGRIKP